MRDIVQKTTYKDYQTYLQSYKNGNSSGSLSQTSSSSSIQSTENETQRPHSEFQTNTGHSKFTGIRIKETRNDQQKKPTVKSELYITINQPIVETNEYRNSKNRFSEIKQKFNGNPGKVNYSSPKIQTQKGEISASGNNAVSDEMIYAKTAVLEELLTTSPTLKKVEPIFAKVEPQLQKSQTITLQTPPPLPTSKPPHLTQTRVPTPPSLPQSSPPRLPQSLPITKPQLVSKNNDQNNISQEQLLKDLHTLMLIQENPNLLNSIPEPPSFVTQQLQAKYSEIEPNITTVVPVAEGVSDVNKSDPNVKTLVYNTYRGLLGAYNNKANNMVSTLPRNAVVQDQGVTRQVESMASQGCLDNINGRVNPKASED